ncbi:succinate-semialdehyde dehydrogenase [Violaceomyces palustris]|uniref:Succinate-semialdehyde dehydrogenase n=1 Tax=Violaceomyces palustris TaxID=1673888 RepID=A0ACD0P1A7_9BASI|nr:succinate-semialdehyde dehydrogenase [Violaceomyces palustris]
MPSAPSVQEFAKSLGLKDPSLLHNQSLIGGKWVDAKSGRRFIVEDPSTGKLLCDAPEMDVEDADEAIAVALKAFDSFRKTTHRARARMLRKLNDLMIENREDIAKVIIAENGKPLWQSQELINVWRHTTACNLSFRDPSPFILPLTPQVAEGLAEVDYAATFIEWFSGEAERTYGATIPASNPANRIITIKQPIGVVAALCPWNLPIAMATRKVGAAIAAGCTTVVKPAGETPYSTLMLGELVSRAGIPDGVVNVLSSLETTPRLGEKFCVDPRVKKISLTGSTRVGKLLVKQSADTLKKLSLELGGNAPVIVYEDADLEKAAKGILVSKLRNGGQTCVSANRILVHRNIADALVKVMAGMIGSMVVGGGSDPKANIGPLISSRAVDKVKHHVEDAISGGAKVVWQYPSPLTGPQFSKGYFYPPTIVTGVNQSMQVWGEETFGPLAAITLFDSEQEAVKLANESKVGLGAYVFTKDMSKAMRTAEEIQTGMVGINTGMLSASESPFGGVNESGYGKEGSFMGIEEYLITKAITMDVS